MKENKKGGGRGDTKERGVGGVGKSKARVDVYARRLCTEIRGTKGACQDSGE